MPTGQCIFPTELLVQILSLTTPRDVIRWRTVSKLLYAITYMPEIWKALYSNAPFMRPYELPPMDCIDLKLVELEQFAQSWIHQPLKRSVLSCVPFCLNLIISGYENNHLIGGRWFITYKLGQFSLFDIHSSPKPCNPQVLWSHTDKIFSWRIILAMLQEEHWVAYVVLSIANTSRLILLELWWDAETGSPCNSIVMKVPNSGPTTSRVVGLASFRHSRFIYLPAQSLVFDTTTRAFYKFPTFTIAFDQTRSRIHSAFPEPDVSVKLTNTHVIVLRDYSCVWKGDPVVAQAFTVPDDQCAVENGKGVLRLSHEGIFDSRQTDHDVIRNSVADFLTGSINVRLLEKRQRWPHPAHKPCCIDLTLHKPPLQHVTPMTITRHDVIVKGSAPKKKARTYDACRDISDEGYARGISVRKVNAIFSTDKRKLVKFAIDATGDRCVVTYGSHTLTEPAPRSSTEMYQIPNYLSLDGGRGLSTCVRFTGLGDSIMMVTRVE